MIRARGLGVAPAPPSPHHPDMPRTDTDRERDADVVILGAGASGLAAARRLGGAGSRVVVLEARHRVGGRIDTRRAEGWPVPIELGAEFVHGRPPETWDVLRAAALVAYDVPDVHWHFARGKL